MENGLVNATLINNIQRIIILVLLKVLVRSSSIKLVECFRLMIDPYLRPFSESHRKWMRICMSLKTHNSDSIRGTIRLFSPIAQCLPTSIYILHLFLTFTSRAGLSHNSKYHISICYECICLFGLYIGHLKRFFFFFFLKAKI